MFAFLYSMPLFRLINPLN
uniref:Uncharacterized protein n=1 Tax=Lepeophtheirus salmonis TaxID=72036 RepID=A0A0K2TEP4_LEPSM